MSHSGQGEEGGKEGLGGGRQSQGGFRSLGKGHAELKEENDEVSCQLVVMSSLAGDRAAGDSA